MRTLFRSCGVLAGLSAAPAWAVTSEEPVNVTCQVLDTNGAELTPDGQARGRDFEGMRALNGSSERFMYDVYLKAGTGRFLLLDKASGEQVVVEQSHFTRGETVSVALIAREHDEATLTLKCVGI